MTLRNGVVAWGMSPSKYVLEDANNCAKHVKYNFPVNYTLPDCAENPFVMGNEAVMCTYKALDSAEAYYFKSIIGVMCWMVEIGRIYIATEVSLLSSRLTYPLEGHIGAALCVMSYLKQKYNSLLVFDPTYPKIDEIIFKDCDWKYFYGNVEEEIPPNAPYPRGKDIDLWAKVYSNHEGDKEIRLLRTGYLIFCHILLVYWLSKRQPMIETYVFGTDFVAMKHVMEALCSICYKILMVGVHLSE